jgi:hypothetical protein
MGDFTRRSFLSLFMAVTATAPAAAKLIMDNHENTAPKDPAKPEVDLPDPKTVKKVYYVDMESTTKEKVEELLRQKKSYYHKIG